MYYSDLSFYRTGGYGDIFEVYPNVKNIGWLDIDSDFVKGSLSSELIQKLKELAFLDVKNQDDIRNGTFEEEKAVIVDQMLTRGAPHQCSFCVDDVVNLSPSEVEIYSGDRIKVLGLNEICIPSANGKVVYSCPTLICHYIESHGYLPPEEFVEALKAFDFRKAYNSNDDEAFDFCVDVPVTEIDNVTTENVMTYPESEEC